MFRELLQGSRRTLVHDAIDEVLRMLEHGHAMFQAACSTMFEAAPPGEGLPRDEDLNLGERMVRRLVFQHLVVTPERDLATSVALLSVVHDVERIGDYAKSLVELSRWRAAGDGGTGYRQTCARLHEQIEPQFDATLRALRDSDTDAARGVMRTHMEVKALTDQLLGGLMEAEEPGRVALFYGLASRYLRRISGHLSNVASSVINPLDQVAGQEVRSD